ncbi:MAG: Maf family nucleotide pyrophosphatase [Actinomycetota bacterium]|nr:Maf family nucleotide pyrophosphatase [Actinomycetota bacterium]
MTSRPRLVLASASPARLATLRTAGLDPEVVVSGVDEDDVGETEPAVLALLLAQRKCAAVAGLVERRDDLGTGRVLVLGCDSVLELDGAAYGKPRDADAAIRRWHQMRGRAGLLHTGHSVRLLAPASTTRHVSALASTVVHFADIGDDEIEAYVATGEPLGVAGGFTLDGRGGPYVRAVDGDPHTVVGLGLPLLRELVGELGIRWHHLWAAPRWP